MTRGSTPAPALVSHRLSALSIAVSSGDADALAVFWQEAADRAGPIIAPATASEYDITFLWRGDAETKRVILFGGFAGLRLIDMQHLLDTDVWYATHRAPAGLARRMSSGRTLASRATSTMIRMCARPS